VVASCWRLAKFNLDTRQTSGFLGLPTPANGCSGIHGAGLLGVAVRKGPGHSTLERALFSLMDQPSLLLIATLGLGAFMLSSIHSRR
jgi:CDP-diacylglycerol--serine O-phosphatidyltransferase